MKIKVTQKIIMAANLLKDLNKNVGLMCYESSLCPISLALNKQTDYHGWFISNIEHNNIENNEWEAMAFRAFKNRKNGKNNPRFRLPLKAIMFLKKWEDREVVGPFSFEVPNEKVIIGWSELKSKLKIKI